MGVTLDDPLRDDLVQRRAQLGCHLMRLDAEMTHARLPKADELLRCQRGDEMPSYCHREHRLREGDDLLKRRVGAGESPT